MERAWIRESSFNTATFQLILSSGGRGHVDHLRGDEDHLPFFFVIFNVILLCDLSGQEAFFAGSLTRDPSLIWNIVERRGYEDVKGGAEIVCLCVCVFVCVCRGGEGALKNWQGQGRRHKIWL